MRRMISRLLFAAAALLLSAAANAIDYYELNDNAIVYDAGSREANPQFILLRGTPVEQIVTTDVWAKVREAGGGMGWIERARLASRTHVIVTAQTADVRSSPDENAPIVFSAHKDVLLQLAGQPVAGWVKVQHPDGQNGYVQVRAIWGL